MKRLFLILLIFASIHAMAKNIHVITYNIRYSFR
jgi:hypothetical protein